MCVVGSARRVERFGPQKDHSAVRCGNVRISGENQQVPRRLALLRQQRFHRLLVDAVEALVEHPTRLPGKIEGSDAPKKHAHGILAVVPE